jgi:hypothetical protein
MYSKIAELLCSGKSIPPLYKAAKLQVVFKAEKSGLELISWRMKSFSF